MKHIRSYQNGLVIGTMGVVVATAIAGCSQGQEQPQNKKIFIEQLASGKYIVTDEIPTQGPSEAYVTQKDGSVRKLSEEELKELAQQEYARVQDGSSETIQSGNGEGMGLAGTILAVGAGVLLGNMVANALMGNKNFQRNQAAATSNSRSFNRGANSANKANSKKSFFNKQGTSRTGGRGFFGG